MNEIEIGKLIVGKAQRDAIHIAVAPVVANEDLECCEQVGILPNGRAGRVEPEHRVGIVDPFLGGKWVVVPAGQSFWLFMFPKTVANLRHDWTHPAFSDEIIKNSKAWIEKYAAMFGKTYDEIMKAAHALVAQKEPDPEDADPTLDDDFGYFVTPPEFWFHFKAITGLEGKGNFWGCCV